MSETTHGQQPIKTRQRKPLAINVDQLPGPALVDKYTRRAVTGLGDSETYDRIAQGRFPAPIKLGPRCSRWRMGDLRAWLADPIGWRAVEAQTKGGTR